MANNTDFQNGFAAGYTARAKGVGNLEQVQTDYLQNDETAVDYLKNRPFYKEEIKSDVTVLAENLMLSFDYSESDYSDVLGELLKANLGKTLTVKIKNASGDTVFECTDTVKFEEEKGYESESDDYYYMGLSGMISKEEQITGPGDYFAVTSYKPDSYNPQFSAYIEVYKNCELVKNGTELEYDGSFLNGNYLVDVLIDESSVITKYNKLDPRFIIDEINFIPAQETVSELNISADLQLLKESIAGVAPLNGYTYFLTESSDNYPFLRVKITDDLGWEAEVRWGPHTVDEGIKGLVRIEDELCYITYNDDADMRGIVEYTDRSSPNMTLFSQITDSELLADRCGCPMIAINNEIYFFGGDDGNSNYKTDVVKLNLETLTVSVVSDKCPVIAYAAAVQKGNLIYFFGGKSADGSEASDLIKVYDIEKNTFSILDTKLPQKTAEAGAEILGDNIYIFGGHYSGKASGELYTIQKFDTLTETTSLLDAESITRDGIVPITVIDKIYLFGGYDDDYENSDKVQVFELHKEKTILDLAPVEEISEDFDSNTIPTTKAVVNYIGSEVSKEIEEVADEIKKVQNLIPEQVQSNYDENNESSKSHIQNRPFYYIPGVTTTETFYSSTEGDPTATYTNDDDSTRIICSSLATITGLENSFCEGAIINASLGVTYKGAAKEKTDIITRSSTVKKYSDNIFYAGSWYWFEENTNYSQDEDFLITYNTVTGEISIYLSAAIKVNSYNILARSDKSVVLTSTYTSPDELKQIDTKFIPDYISKSEVINEIKNNATEVKSEIKNEIPQSNYEENDSDSLSHIQNRPFYKEQILVDYSYPIKTGIPLSIDESGYGTLDESIESILEANVGNTLTFTVKDADGNIKGQYTDLIKMSTGMVSSPNLNIAYAGNRVFITSMKADRLTEETSINYCIRENMVVIVTGYSFNSGMINVTNLRAPYHGDNFTLDVEMTTKKETIYHTIDENFLPDVINNATKEYINNAVEEHRIEVQDLINNQSSANEIPSVTNPNIWELDFGLYRVRNSFYYSEEEPLYDPSFVMPSNPNGSIRDGQIGIKREALLFIYAPASVESNMNITCNFIVIDETDFYHGSIGTSSILNINNETVEYQKGEIAKTSKTTTINENSTDNELASAKAVYDLVQQAVQDALYVNEEDTV